jgi:putative glutamine amidotransferase
VQGRIDRIEEGRTHMELELARIVLDENIPVLGICGGMQAMAVADGGTLCQNIPTSTVAHEQSNDPAQTSHAVTLNQSASRWLPSILQVNSTHHQAVATCGKRLKACGWAPDGCIEVIASDNHPFALGLQWHPELIDQLDAYRALISSARKSKL